MVDEEVPVDTVHDGVGAVSGAEHARTPAVRDADDAATDAVADLDRQLDLANVRAHAHAVTASS